MSRHFDAATFARVRAETDRIPWAFRIAPSRPLPTLAVAWRAEAGADCSWRYLCKGEPADRSPLGIRRRELDGSVTANGRVGRAAAFVRRFRPKPHVAKPDGGTLHWDVAACRRGMREEPLEACDERRHMPRFLVREPVVPVAPSPESPDTLTARGARASASSDPALSASSRPAGRRARVPIHDVPTITATEEARRVAAIGRPLMPDHGSAALGGRNTGGTDRAQASRRGTGAGAAGPHRDHEIRNRLARASPSNVATRCCRRELRRTALLPGATPILARDDPRLHRGNEAGWSREAVTSGIAQTPPRTVILRVVRRPTRIGNPETDRRTRMRARHDPFVSPARDRAAGRSAWKHPSTGSSAAVAALSPRRHPMYLRDGWVQNFHAQESTRS